MKMIRNEIERKWHNAYSRLCQMEKALGDDVSKWEDSDIERYESLARECSEYKMYIITIGTYNPA